MSAFIGPIHYWLYGKIKVVNSRERHIAEAAAAVCGDTVEEIQEQVWQTYGTPLPDVDLGELIDHGNIHGWLQRQINIAESREAALVKELVEQCGTAKALLEDVFREHGAKYGQEAAGEGRHELASAPGIYKALNDYYLNGMPCDQSDLEVESKPEIYAWSSGECIQQPNWKRAGVDEALIKGLYQLWLGAFVSAANPGYAFRVQRLENGAETRYEIYKVQ